MAIEEEREQTLRRDGILHQLSETGVLDRFPLQPVPDLRRPEDALASIQLIKAQVRLGLKRVPPVSLLKQTKGFLDDLVGALVASRLDLPANQLLKLGGEGDIHAIPPRAERTRGGPAESGPSRDRFSYEARRLTVADTDEARRRQGGANPGIDAFADYRRRAAEREAAGSRRPVAPAGAALLCAALVVVASFGPWLHRRRGTGVATETVTGLQLDGPVAIGGAVVAALALLVVLARPDIGAAAWVAIAGLATAALVGAANWLLLDTIAPGYTAQHRGATFELAWGLGVVIAAAVAGSAAAVWLLRRLDD